MDVQTSLLGLDTRLGSVVSQELIASEIPLPEGRDVSEVLDAYARIFVEESECLTGAIRVSGRLELCCVCVSMSGEVYGFSAQSSFTHTLTLASVQPHMHALLTAQVLECTALPDALRLKLTVVLELTAFVSDPVTTPFVTGISGAKEIERRMTALETRRRVRLADSTIRLREESDASGVHQVLLYHGAAQVTQLNYSGASTCESEGRVLVTALVETASGEAQSMLLTLPFTCSFDAPYLTNVWAECVLESLSVVAADVSFGVIDTEAVLKLTLFGVETAVSDVLLDAYDPNATFSCQTELVERMQCLGSAQQTFSIQESVLIPQELPDAVRPVYATAMPAVTGLFEADGMLGADVMLLTCVVYRGDEGRMYAFHEDIPAQLRFNVPYATDAQLSVRTLGCVPTGSGRALTVSYTLEGTALLYDTEPVQLATALTAGGEACPYSGVLIYCAGAGETVWDVGKRFHVPMQSLALWNPELGDPLAEGQAVVLMR